MKFELKQPTLVATEYGKEYQLPNYIELRTAINEIGNRSKMTINNLDDLKVAKEMRTNYNSFQDNIKRVRIDFQNSIVGKINYQFKTLEKELESYSATIDKTIKDYELVELGKEKKKKEKFTLTIIAQEESILNEIKEFAIKKGATIKNAK